MTCGGGKQTRKVDCLRGGNISKLCNENKRPLSERSCNNYKCSLSAGNEQGEKKQKIIIIFLILNNQSRIKYFSY